MREKKRAFRSRNPTANTSSHLSELLPRVLQRIGRQFAERGDLVMAAWPSVVGPNLAPMTRAVSFIEGILTVKVNNSTLHSLLTQVEKPRVLKNLRDKFPNTKIKTIVFRLG